MGQTRVPGSSVRDGTLTDVDVSTANKDGLPGVPSMRTLGTGSQQACAGNDQRLSPESSFEFFKQTGVLPFEVWYVAGQATAQNLGTASAGVNVLRALPLVVPTGGVVDQLVIHNTGTGPTSTARVGLYEATSQTNLYPGTLLFDSGVISLSVSGNKISAVSPTVTLEKGKLYWLCHVGGGSSEALRSLSVGACYPIFGVTTAFTNTSPAVGLSVPFTFGPLPSSFPTGATLLQGPPIPAIAARLA